jgi:hypothetical protein
MKGKMIMFTARESELIYASKPGDVIPIGDELILINVNASASSGNIGGMILGCEQFARCGDKATQLLPHPILTYVPSCDRCAKILTM